MEGLTSLRHLLLSHNQIFQLPPELHQMERLETIDVYSNQIPALPQV
jgi:Leucine-rich repeat (LRR) protein